MLAKSFEENDLTFAIGPAGSGKTFVAIALAVKALKSKQVRRIILSRPAVEAGEKLDHVLVGHPADRAAGAGNPGGT